jgi:hypothetical protein
MQGAGQHYITAFGHLESVKDGQHNQRDSDQPEYDEKPFAARPPGRPPCNDYLSAFDVT